MQPWFTAFFFDIDIHAMIDTCQSKVFADYYQVTIVKLIKALPNQQLSILKGEKKNVWI